MNNQEEKVKIFKFKTQVKMDVTFKKVASNLAVSPASYQADFLNHFFNELLLVTKSKEGLINQITEMEKHLDEFTLMGLAGILKSYEERSK